MTAHHTTHKGICITLTRSHITYTRFCIALSNDPSTTVCQQYTVSSPHSANPAIEQINPKTLIYIFQQAQVQHMKAPSLSSLRKLSNSRVFLSFRRAPQPTSLRYISISQPVVSAKIRARRAQASCDVESRNRATLQPFTV